MGIDKKHILIIGIVFGGLIVAGSTMTILFGVSKIEFTLLSNAGVMIESKEVRIYVDPFYLSVGYRDPADIVCITHPHTDHYVAQSITSIQKEGTINIFPETMSDAITLFDGVGLNPEEEYVFSDEITIQAFYMYTDESLHLPESNWTSYLIDIKGFVFFFSGDSGNVTEYQQLTGLVDVAVLNYVPNFLMNNMEMVDAINTIQPQYVILAHATFADVNNFYANFGDLFSATFISLDNYDSYKF